MKKPIFALLLGLGLIVAAFKYDPNDDDLRVAMFGVGLISVGWSFGYAAGMPGDKKKPAPQREVDLHDARDVLKTGDHDY